MSEVPLYDGFCPEAGLQLRRRLLEMRAPYPPTPFQTAYRGTLLIRKRPPP